MVPIESPLVVSYLTSVGSNVVARTVFEIFDVKILWPRSRTVQGHPRSNVMVPIDSSWVVSYSTSIDSIVVSVTVFEIFDVQFQWPWTRRVQRHPIKVNGNGANRKPISSFLSDLHWVQRRILHRIREFDVKILWPRSRTVQGHPRSKVMVPIESPWAVSYLTSFESNIVSLAIFEILTFKIFFRRSNGED